jgi:subtilisin family serine protease
MPRFQVTSGLLYLLLWGFLFFGNPSMAIVGPSSLDQAYQPGHLLVKIKPGMDIRKVQALGATIGAKVQDTYSLVPGLYLFLFDDKLAVQEVLEYFSAKPEVEYAEPNYYYEIQKTVDDPSFSKLYGLENNGQTGGKKDADINAEAMWDISTGDAAIVIGVIDTGVDYNHQDLIDNMWRNPGEIPNNFVDDDKNGYSDDVHGLNAILGVGNPMDDNKHGTHVAGTIGAQGNNALGVVGVAHDVQIAACKFLNASGSGTLSNAIGCMQYFADLKSRAVNPVNLVATNNSWGGGSASQALSDAIKRHEELGILFIAAAGNSTSNNDVFPSYPANYALSNVISVAATDHNDALAGFSNYGRNTVHVAAPGVKILSTTPNNRYQELSGTSMATPHVSGLVAVIASHFKGINYRQIKNLVMTGGQAIPSVAEITISKRRIRGADAGGVGSLTCQNQLVQKKLAPSKTSLVVAAGDSVFLSALNINCANAAGALKVFEDEFQTVTLEDNGLNGDLVANDGIASLTWTPTRTGSYSLNFGDQVVNVNVDDQSKIGRYEFLNVDYSYEEIAGTRLNVGDDTVHEYASPFPIAFGNATSAYTNLYISSNGTLSFTSVTDPGPVNQSLPTNLFSTLVAPFWDDLIPRGTLADVYVETVGEAPNRKLVVEWRNMSHYRASGTATFQVVFYESSSDVRFNYLDTSFTHPSYDSGAAASVGLQTSSDYGLLVGFNTPVAEALSSILFKLK